MLHNTEIIDKFGQERTIAVAQKERAEGEARLVEVNSDEMRVLVYSLQKKYKSIQKKCENQECLIQHLGVLSRQINDIYDGIVMNTSLDVFQKKCDEVESLVKEYEALKAKINISALIESVDILKSKLELIKEGAPKNYLYFAQETTKLESQLVHLNSLSVERERHAKEESIGQARRQASKQAEQQKTQEETLLANQLLDILDDVFSQQNSRHFWNMQVKFKFGAYLCGSKVDVGTVGEPYMVSVPRGVCGARNALDTRSSGVSAQNILKEICYRVDARLPKDSNNWDKPTEVLYHQITQFVGESGALSLTQNKIDSFLTFLKEDARFNSLILKEHDLSKNLVNK